MTNIVIVFVITTFWIKKNYSFIGMLWYLVTFRICH